MTSIPSLETNSVTTAKILNPQLWQFKGKLRGELSLGDVCGFNFKNFGGNPSI